MYVLKLHNPTSIASYFTYFSPSSGGPQFETYRMSIFPLDVAQNLEKELRREWNTFVTVHPLTVGDALKQNEDDGLPNVMPRVNGKSFRCECGCNVFKEVQPLRFKCNSCSATYSGEK